MTVCKKALFNKVGAFRSAKLPQIPCANGFLSVNANSGLWQLAHETLPSFERRVSKNKARPRAILSSVVGLSAGKGTLAINFSDGSHAFIINNMIAPKNRRTVMVE
jgi:hypothetical protein